MKSIFLYKPIKPHFPTYTLLNGIYKLSSDLIGIDTNIVDKKFRQNLVAELNLREVCILQRWFANFMIFVDKFAEKIGIKILSVDFIDEVSNEESFEISKLILDSKYLDLVEAVSEICEENDTDIKCINFSYKRCVYTIYYTGVLNVVGKEVNDSTEPECLVDASFLSVLAGKGFEDINA